MCGCSGGSSIGYKSFSRKLSSTSCNTKYSQLTQYRNKLAILFNVTTDSELKSDYRQSLTNVDNILKDIATNKECPSTTIITEIKKEIEYEYSKYRNS